MTEPQKTPTLNPLLFLRGRKLTTAEYAAAGIFLGQTAWGTYRKFKERQQERNTVSLKFKEDSQEYHWLCRWLAKQPRLESRSNGRVFAAKSIGREDYPTPLETKADSDHGPHDWVLVPESFNGFQFEGMTLGIQKGEPIRREGESYMEINRFVTVICLTRDMTQVERFLEAVYIAGNEDSHEKKIPMVYALNRWGDWTQVRKAPANRVPVLPAGVLETLSQDLSWFLQNESWYQSVGIPYRRGYLLHGIPGSGKTTTAIALASHFKRDIYVLPIEGLSDENMMNAISTAGREAILLIEDIDCAAVTHSRDEGSPSPGGKNTPTLQGLLNAIDGVATPEGRVLIATTNHRNRLDPALIRPGRFDRDVVFTHADKDQIEELCRRFGLGPEAGNLAKEWHAEGVSTATVQQRLIERNGVAPYKTT